MRDIKKEIKLLLEELQITIDERADELILITMNTETYENREGEHFMKILITPGKESHVVETIMIIAPFAYVLNADANIPAFHEFFMVQNFSNPLVKFSYDPQDGEIQARVDIAIGKAPLQKDQLAFAFTALHSTMENIHDQAVAIFSQKPSFKQAEKEKAKNIIDQVLTPPKSTAKTTNDDDDMWL